MNFWAEVRNDFFETQADILPEEGDLLASVSIDAWKTLDDNEGGSVIARVMLSKHGDILVNYIDGVARSDKMAQSAILDAKQQLREYFEKLRTEASKDFEEATYVSVWDGGYVVETACKVNRQTREVFDIEVSEGAADFVNVLDEEYVRFADGTEVSVEDGWFISGENTWPLRNYGDAVVQLREVLNTQDYQLDFDDNWIPMKADMFIPIFKSEHYFGIYVWHNDKNQYYLVDRNTGEHQMVLGDSFEFVGKNLLDCMKDEKILHVANQEYMRYLIDFSLENVKNVVPERELGGIAVLESAWRKERKKQGFYVMGQSLAERIQSAKDRAGHALAKHEEINFSKD